MIRDYCDLCGDNLENIEDLYCKECKKDIDKPTLEEES